MSQFQHHRTTTPKAFTRPTFQGVNQMHIADGFVDDCDELIHECSHFEPLTFEKFTEIWMEMKMGSFYYERAVGAEMAELSEEVIQIAKRYLVANTSKFEESVAGLFMVYCLITLQPFKDFAALRLVPEDMPAIRRIELVARRDRRHDVLYILGQVLIKGPVQYHAANREYGFETTLRKYHEGTTNLDNYGVRPKGVFYRQNEELDIIKELHSCFSQYHNIKNQLKDASGRPDPNLRFSDKDMVTQLESSLKRIINGLIEEDVKPGSSFETDERVDRIREIKSRALNQAIDPIKHRTTVNHKKPNPTSTITSPPNKPDIVSKPGRVKSGSPMKPVTTGKRKQGKRGKRAAIKRQKKNNRDLSETLTDDEDNPEAEIDLPQFQRVEVEIERINENEEPDIEELVEKEYDIHIDTMPIVIKGNVEGNSSQKIEIEFIDQYQPPDSGSGPTKSNEETFKGVTQRINNLADVSITKVGETSGDNDEQISEDDLPLKLPSTDNLNNMLTPYKQPSGNNHENSYRLRKPERRDLKKRHLKSKFKKMGLERLANFQESQKYKKN